MRTFFATLLLAASGCQTHTFPPLAEHHPANPAAAESPEPALPDALRQTPAPPPAPEPMQRGGHAH